MSGVLHGGKGKASLGVERTQETGARDVGEALLGGDAALVVDVFDDIAEGLVVGDIEVVGLVIKSISHGLNKHHKKLGGKMLTSGCVWKPW